MSHEKASREWLHQRYTAVFTALGVFASLILISICAYRFESILLYTNQLEDKIIGLFTGKLNVSHFFKSPINTVLTCGLVIGAVYHGCIGMKIILEDYVKGMPRKLGIAAIFLTSYLICGLFCLNVVTLHVKSNLTSRTIQK